MNKEKLLIAFAKVCKNEEIVNFHMNTRRAANSEKFNQIYEDIKNI